MAFKQSKKPKNQRQKESVRVKNAYYTFSKDYPAGILYTEPKTSKSDKRKKIFKIFSLILCVAVFVCLGYFSIALLSDISKSEVRESPSKSERSLPAEAPDFSGMNSAVFPSEKLSDFKYIENFIKTVKRNGASSVIIDFKNESGKLVYSSDLYYEKGNSVFDNETVRKALSRFTSKGIKIFAGLNCFKDNYGANLSDTMPIRYKQSEVSWTDSNDNFWLNPYSSDVLNYLEGIVREILDFKVDGIVLKNCSFPDNGDVESANCIGETDKNKRGAVIEKFVLNLRKIGAKSILFFTDFETVNGDSNPFYCDIFDVSDSVVVDMRSVKVDKNEDYMTALSSCSSVSNRSKGKNCLFLFESDSLKYSFRRLLKSTKRNFVRNFEN